jgi:hypothetical protein
MGKLTVIDPVNHARDWIVDNWNDGNSAIVNRMIEDQSEAQKLLTHPDWKVRRTAICILNGFETCQLNTSLGNQLESIGFTDSHPQVRSAALMGLGICYRVTMDTGIGRVLAAVVLDDSEDSAVRRGAYFGLFYLSRRPFGWEKDIEGGPGVLNIPDDIDWSFVSKFCN